MSLTRSLDLRLTMTGERSLSQTLLLNSAYAVAGSLFVALCAHIAIPVPFTPVPFTLQPFAVLLVGMLLGPAMGFAALAAYLAEGAAGLPVFTPGGLGGVAQLLGPTGGFLFAYPAAAALAGAGFKLTSKMPRFAAFTIVGAIATALIFTSGAMWFAHLLHLPLSIAAKATVFPFAASDAVKVCAAAGIASALRGKFQRS